jgi:uncharacterized membrane protein
MFRGIYATVELTEWWLLWSLLHNTNVQSRTPVPSLPALGYSICGMRITGGF